MTEASHTLDDVPTQRTPDRISWSSLSLLARCGVAWEYRYLKRIRRPPSTALVRGRVVDHAANLVLDTKFQTMGEEQVTVEQALDTARDRLETEWEQGIALDEDEAQVGEAKTKARTVDSVTGLTRVFVTEFEPVTEPAEPPQHRFAVEVPGMTTLVGVWDYRTEHPTAPAIHDLKTRKRAPASNEADDSEQATLYALAAYVTEGVMPSSLALDVLVETPGGKRYARRLQTQRTEEDLPRLLRLIENGLRVVESGAFVPAALRGDWSCRYCEYNTICPYYRGRVQV